MRVVLIGYRGSGKTTVGRKLAAALAMTFFDADAELVARAGRSVKAIFEQSGEAAFRDLESAALTDLLTRPDAVLSLGGGVVLREANRERLMATNAVRIYLHADPQTLHARIHADPATAVNRPALTHLGGGIEEIRTLLAQREPLYRAMATHTLDVSMLDVDAVVARLLGSIGPQMNADERKSE